MSKSDVFGQPFRKHTDGYATNSSHKDRGGDARIGLGYYGLKLGSRYQPAAPIHRALCTVETNFLTSKQKIEIL